MLATGVVLSTILESIFHDHIVIDLESKFGRNYIHFFRGILTTGKINGRGIKFYLWEVMAVGSYHRGEIFKDLLFLIWGNFGPYLLVYGLMNLHVLKQNLHVFFLLFLLIWIIYGFLLNLDSKRSIA